MAAKQHLTLRVKPEDLAEIDHRANAHGLSRTEYAVRAMLCKLGNIGLDDRVDGLERRIEQLERMRDLGGY